MIPKRTVRLVLERDGQVCQLNLDGCTYVATVADHRANRGMGGSKLLDNPVNLIAACEKCNGAKENATGDVLDLLIRRGVRVLRAATTERTVRRAALTLVTYRDGRLYQLDGVGGREHIRSS